MGRAVWVVHLDGDAFAVAVERRRGRAPQRGVVLVGDDAGGRGTVACASYEARTQGVAAGMALAWARWRLNGAAVVVGRDVLAWEEAGRNVYRFLEGAAPVVEMAGLDDFYLDLTGCDRWCGGDVGRWVMELLGRLKTATGLPFSAGVAGNKSVARLATRLGKPGGLTLVRRGAEGEFLRAMPLKFVPELEPAVADQLEEFGCRRVEDVLALGRDRLRTLFGAEGERLWFVLRGEWMEPVRPTRLARCVEVEHLFEPDTCDPVEVAAGLRLAVEKLAWELRRCGQRCTRLVFTGVYCDGTMVRRVGRAAYATDRTHELAALARPWVGALGGRRVRVRRIQLRAPTEGGGVEVADFLEEQRLARTARLYEALDRVRERYGLASLISATALPAVEKALRAGRRAHDWGATTEQERQQRGDEREGWGRRHGGRCS